MSHKLERRNHFLFRGGVVVLRTENIGKNTKNRKVKVSEKRSKQDAKVKAVQGRPGKEEGADSWDVDSFRLAGKSHHHSCAQHRTSRQNWCQEPQLKSPAQAANQSQSKQIRQRPGAQYEHVCIFVNINIQCAPGNHRSQLSQPTTDSKEQSECKNR